MTMATNVEEYQNRMPTVLIVDDDIDAVIRIEKILQQMGCNTLTALDSSEAQRELMSGKVDLVILDWCLEKGRLASHLLTKVSTTLDKFFKVPFEEGEQTRKTVIVTHSALSENEVSVPQSDYFLYADHWKKPIDRNELVRRTSEVLKAVGF